MWLLTLERTHHGMVTRTSSLPQITGPLWVRETMVSSSQEALGSVKLGGGKMHSRRLGMDQQLMGKSLAAQQKTGQDMAQEPTV